MKQEGEASGEWRDIESAPKDVAILVYATGCKIAHFNTACGKWIGYDVNTSDTANMNSFNPPTHWQPLPPPPRELGK